MAYNELIKNYEGIRKYLREFFVYGFKSRNQYNHKSARSYDNERRRIESWLSAYVFFRQDALGKNIFISLDSRDIIQNPFYKTWRTASFTKNDINLHFMLLDILCFEDPKSITMILDIIEDKYISMFENPEHIDESTLRKKLYEYTKIGIISAIKEGKQIFYQLPESKLDLQSWENALCFFSEENPLGVIGYFLLNKYKVMPESFFSFKHNYLLFALDSGIIRNIMTAFEEHRKIEITFFPKNGQNCQLRTVLPTKIYISTQGGRQYLLCIQTHTAYVFFCRLDNIKKIKLLDIEIDYQKQMDCIFEKSKYIWGVSTGNNRTLQHIEMCLHVLPQDHHIVARLKREKRCGTVTALDDNRWLFSADVYDAREVLTWLRSFMGRIESMTCSHKGVEKQFWDDYKELLSMYDI